MKATLSVLLLLGCLYVIGVEAVSGSPTDRKTGGANPASVQCGDTLITVVDVYAWRDWMPVVARPGPDGGSPLHIKGKFRLENPSAKASKTTFRITVLDPEGKAHAVPFKVLPNYAVLPDDVYASFKHLDGRAKEEVCAKYRVMWDGFLAPGEDRTVELATADGPYVPVRGRIVLEVNWTDERGRTAVLRTLPAPVHRTD